MCTPSGGPGQGQKISNRADIKMAERYKIDLHNFLCDLRNGAKYSLSRKFLNLYGSFHEKQPLNQKYETVSTRLRKR